MKAHPRVRRTRAPGLASTYLHKDVAAGTVLRVSAPAGEFYLDDRSTRPVVLLSGGVGLTPTISILEHLVDRGVPRDVWFVHAPLFGRHHAMKRYVQEVGHVFGSTGGHRPRRGRRFLPQPANLVVHKGQSWSSSPHRHQVGCLD
jgi:ferredoxin-NADP reductase